MRLLNIGLITDSNNDIFIKNWCLYIEELSHNVEVYSEADLQKFGTFDLVLCSSIEGYKKLHQTTAVVIFPVCQYISNEDIIWPNITPVISLYALFGGNKKLIFREEINHGIPDIINGADLVSVIQKYLVELIIEVVNKAARSEEIFLNFISSNNILTDSDANYRDLDVKLLRSFHKFNETDLIFEDSESIIERVCRIANGSPDNIAIIDNFSQISYASLLQKVKENAGAIYSLSKANNIQIQSGSFIGISLPKSIDLYTNILSILYLGSAYVPLDPSYPEDVLLSIVEDSNILVIVTSELFAPIFRKLAKVTTIITISDIESNIGIIETKDPISKKESSNDVIVAIFTSGSTGKPKGTQISNRNLINFCQWYISYVNLSQGNRVLQFSTINFDASLLDIFPTFLVSATLLAPTEEQRIDYESLVNLIKQERITHAFIPPLALALMNKTLLPDLKHIVTGGDICEEAVISLWSKDHNLHNVYGPTESTIVATVEEFKDDTRNRIIGKPISNTKVYILDDDFQPVCTDEVGNLYISGAGVGLGYLNNAKLTEERFLPNPFNSSAGHSTFYATGDRARWIKNGIEYVGRKDLQVKLRGFRVDLGEIESLIGELGLYLQVSVVATPNKQIIAYLANSVFSSSKEQNIDKIRKHCHLKLPDYMRPLAYIELDEFPAIKSGKIDRKKLSEREVNFAKLDQPIVTAKSEEQKKLVSIWSELLSIPEGNISINDNFFDIGGHSILLSKMLLKVNSSFKRNVSLARFMENPTIDSLSDLLVEKENKKVSNIPPKIFEDIKLPSNIHPIQNVKKDVSQSVFLTGATGFLGIFLLESLIRKPNIRCVYCLIRAYDELQAKRRISDLCQKFKISDMSCNNKVVFVVGDISKEQFGLSCELYKHLAAEVDTVVHSAANVNHVLDYSKLYFSNVYPAIEILKFCSELYDKSFHFISTISAVSDISDDGRVTENGAVLKLPKFINNGYNLSKWVCELLLDEASNRGFKINIYRPGNISFDSRTGITTPDQNRIMLMIKGCLQLGIFPSWNMQFDIMPVNFLAEAIARILADRKTYNQILNLHNPKPLLWLDYIDSFRKLGFDYKVVDPETWRSSIVDVNDNNALFSVLGFYLDEISEDIDDVSIINYSRTAKILSDHGLEYPDKDLRLLETGNKYLIDSSFIQISTEFEA
jgi:amino acid adenylation domain-containing protein/thioester reductase-like protein